MKRAVSYRDVRLTDGFFGNYQKLMICRVLPAAILNVEKETGGMPNIQNAAKMHRGEAHQSFSGMFYVDSDVHKVLESMCYALMADDLGDAQLARAKEKIAAKLEAWIPDYVDAAEPDGYFDTYFILNPEKERFSDVDRHELYCMGHFIEAAIAHYHLTKGEDSRLFDMALRCAEYLCDTFGEGKRKQIPGHQEIELALLRLADVVDITQAERYRNLAAFFLSVRGDEENRSAGGSLPALYWQDHLPVHAQREAVGHAVRAQYMYTAMAELALCDEHYRTLYHDALTSLWQDVTERKQYVTGGVGQSRDNEGFDRPYYLPNDKAYCETCAGIANMLWNRSMSKLYDGAKYADIIENVLYNAVLGSVNLDGDRFYYHNALCGDDARNVWYGTACCPPNLTRTMLSLGGYIYNVDDDRLYINQYIANRAELIVSGQKIGVEMTSDLPKNGKVKLVFSMEQAAKMTLYLRIPTWSEGGGIRFDGGVMEERDGYAVIDGVFRDGFTVQMDFGMSVRMERSDKRVIENQGRVALCRGPLAYCAEAVDHDFDVTEATLDTVDRPVLLWKDNLDGGENPFGVRGMYCIDMEGVAEQKPVKWRFVPFFARANRGKSQMTVFVRKNNKMINQNKKAE